MTPASRSLAATRWESRRRTAERWARSPTARSACPCTPPPTRPPARWTGGCSCPSPGTTMPSGAARPTCPPTSCHLGRCRWSAGRWALRRRWASSSQDSGRISAYAEDVAPETVPYTGRGRRPVARYRQRRSSLRQLVLAAGEQTARAVAWREGADGQQLVSRFVALRVRPAGVRLRRAVKGSELPMRWLLAEWPDGEPEPVTYWLASLPAEVPLARLDPKVRASA